MTTDWTPDELRRIGDATELEVASYRADGTRRPYVTIWTVATGDEVYIRSAHGVDNPWFRRAVAAGHGRIRAGGVERDVDFVPPGRADPTQVDAAYHVKYDRFGQQYVGPVTGEQAADATLRLLPR